VRAVDEGRVRARAGSSTTSRPVGKTMKTLTSLSIELSGTVIFMSLRSVQSSFPSFKFVLFFKTPTLQQENQNGHL
jgi:hypothetical protein